MPYLKNAGLLAAAAMLASAALVSAQTPEPLPVCVGADRVVRHAPEERCGPGFTYYLLQERALGVSGKEGENAPADVAELRKQIDFLRERMAQLEKHVDDELEMAGRMSHQVMAPFEVLDKKLNPILLVTESDADPKRGLVTIRPAGGGQNFAVQFRTPGGTIAAQMGVGKSGAGVLIVHDESGRPRGELWGSRGLEIYNPAGHEVASLSLDNGSNGALQLNSSGGSVMVAAGADGPVGTVYTGPGYLCSGNAGLRTPSCIKGLLK